MMTSQWKLRASVCRLGGLRQGALTFLNLTGHRSRGNHIRLSTTYPKQRCDVCGGNLGWTDATKGREEL